MWNYLLDLALVAHPIIAYLSARYPKMGIQESKKQFFYLSFLAILALRYSVVAQAPVVNIDAAATEAPLVDVCQTHDQPNPIASLYPGNATGTLNGTVTLLPISLALARQLIPRQYRILEHAYRAMMPAFPADMYPAVLQAVHDHDVQAFGYKIPDFSVSRCRATCIYQILTPSQRTGIEFPFLDLLGDNTTSFKWAPSMLMSAENVIALSGAADYGTTVFPSAFDPPCDAYRAAASSNTTNPASGTTLLNGDSIDGGAAVRTSFAPASAELSTPFAFYKNVTNQPTFADGKTCDNMIRLFNTSLSTGANAIEAVQGDVTARMWPLEGEQAWAGVEGIRFSSAFIENNYLPCEMFRGYGGSAL
jgi:hypothetical protein